MKQQLLWSALLLLTASPVVESRTWRSPPKTYAVLSRVRGGSSENPMDTVPVVPLDTLTNAKPSNLQQDVARGGSTRTRRLPSTAAIKLHPVTKTPLASSTSSSSATATPSSTTTHVEPAVLVSSPAIKHHKRHKHIAKKLKSRNATNLRRKIMHASFGFFFAGLNHFIPRAKFVPGMTLLTSATLVMELLRYRKGFGWMNDILHLVLGSSLRKHEMDGKFTGSFYYFLGVTLTAAMYPKACATMGICQLAIADPTASYFGRATRHVYWSRIEKGFGGLGRNKGILGFLGGGLACVPMNYRLLSIAKFGRPVSSSALWFASFALGMAGAFADLAVPTPALVLPKKVLGVRVPPFHVDDNVVVPVFSAFACKKIFEFVQFPADLALAKYLVV